MVDMTLESLLQIVLGFCVLTAYITAVLASYFTRRACDRETVNALKRSETVLRDVSRHPVFLDHAQVSGMLDEQDGR
jgi:hypothetical protein